MGIVATPHYEYAHTECCCGTLSMFVMLKHVQKLHTVLTVIITFLGQVSFPRTAALNCALCFVDVTIGVNTCI